VLPHKHDAVLLVLWAVVLILVWRLRNSLPPFDLDCLFARDPSQSCPLGPRDWAGFGLILLPLLAGPLFAVRAVIRAQQRVRQWHPGRLVLVWLASAVAVVASSFVVWQVDQDISLQTSSSGALFVFGLCAGVALGTASTAFALTWVWLADRPPTNRTTA